ncbi:MAG: transglycosylase domain-containing protein, partial [Candidatus Adiutrix sp.]
AVARAAFTNLSQGWGSGGASTITQQVVRGLLLTAEKTLSRKIKEAILAFRIEGNLSKDEILYIYLNQIYLGRGAYGVEAAARTYFDKSVENLTIAEGAILAGITHSPEGKNPINNPSEARLRQLHAIRRMATVGYITSEEAEDARNEVVTIRTHIPNPNTTMTPYFAEHVRRILEEKFGADSLYNDGWKIYTTVNVQTQQQADNAANRGLWEHARRRGFQGPIQHIALDEQISEFLLAAEKNMPATGLSLNNLYQAVIMDLDLKDSSLLVRSGPYHGRINKKDLNWALRGEFKNRFKRGDVVWVRLLEESPPTPQSSPAAQTETPDLASALAQNGSQVYPMALEQKTDLQVALLSMDTATGDVKAMVGGRDFSESQFNRAIQSQRQPGSSFKPVVYAAAMDNGFTPGSVMVDAPLVIDDIGSRRRWKPVNSDLKFKGPMSLYSALVSSRNLITIKLLDRIGFEALDE